MNVGAIVKSECFVKLNVGYYPLLGGWNLWQNVWRVTRDNKHWQERWWMDTSSWMFTQGNRCLHTNTYKSFGGKLNFILMSVHLPLILSGINICDSACIEFVHAILVEVFANSERWIEIFGNTLAYLMKYTCISDEIHLHISDEIHFHMWWNTLAYLMNYGCKEHNQWKFE